LIKSFGIQIRHEAIKQNMDIPLISLDGMIIFELKKGCI